MPFTSSRTSVANKRPKILIYGEAGSGKTLTALSFPGRPALIDAEEGTIPYRDQLDFGLIEAEDYREVLAAVDGLIRDPAGFTTLILDPITTVYQHVRQIADDTLRPKATRKNRDITEFDQVTSFGANDRIAAIVRTMFKRFRDLDMAVIVTARAKKKKNDKGDVIGIEYVGPAEIDNEVDAVFELRRFGSKNVARLVKVRGVKGLPEEIEADSPQELAAAIAAVFWPGAFDAPSKPGRVVGAATDAGGTVTNNGPRMLASGEQLGQIDRLVAQLGYTHDDLQKALRKRGIEGGVNAVTVQVAREMIETLGAQLAKREEVPPLEHPPEEVTGAVTEEVKPGTVAPAGPGFDVTTSAADHPDEIKPAVEVEEAEATAEERAELAAAEREAKS